MLYTVATDGMWILQAIFDATAFGLSEPPTEIMLSYSDDKIVKIDEKFLPDPVHINSDWNESDPDSDSYIENRTHWSKIVTNYIIEKATCNSWGGSGNFFKMTFDTDIVSSEPLVEGKTYIVLFGDTEYECKCHKSYIYSESLGLATVLGNDGVLDGSDGSGEPFLIYKYDNENSYGVLVRYGDYTRNIAVYTKFEEIQKLDLKYIPESIVHDKPFEEEVLYNFTLEDAIDIKYDGTGKMYAKFSNDPGNYRDDFIGSIYSLYDENGIEIKSGSVDVISAWNVTGLYSIDVSPFFAESIYIDNESYRDYEFQNMIFFVTEDSVVHGQYNADEITLTKGIWVEAGLLDPSIIGIKSVKVTKVHKTIHPMYEQPSDWNENDDKLGTHIKNRTHYAKTSIQYTWDGNIDGLEPVSYDKLSNTKLYPIGNANMASYITNDRLKAAIVEIKEIGDIVNVRRVCVNEALEECLFTDDYAILANTLLVTRKDNVLVFETTIPKAGVYFRHREVNGKLTYVSNLILPDEVVKIPEIYIPDTIARKSDLVGLGGSSDASVQSDWSQNNENAPDYIKNKTHGIISEGWEITWDGDISVDENPVEIYGMMYYRVSDDMPSNDALKTSSARATIIYNGLKRNQEISIANSWEHFVSNGFISDSYAFVQYAVVIREENTVFNGVTFTRSGTYFLHIVDDDGPQYLSMLGEPTNILKLDPMYLPSSVTHSSTGKNAEIFNGYDGNVIASGDYSHAEGYYNVAVGEYSHVEGYYNEAHGNTSHVEGCRNKAYGEDSHVEGYNNVTYGDESHAEGYCNKASGENSHAEGTDTEAFGLGAHAEGSCTTAYGDHSHAEGVGDCSALSLKIFGNPNVTTYYYADGTAMYGKVGETIIYKGNSAKIVSVDTSTRYITVDTTLSTDEEVNGYARILHSGIAFGRASHIEGYENIAYGDYSHAEGHSNIARGDCQHVQGKLNIEDTENKYIHITGNGYFDNDTFINIRSNAHTLDWSGTGWFAGGLQIGGNAQDSEGVKYVPAVPTAAVGQTIVVKSLDNNGKPTEWECVDLPSSSNNEHDHNEVYYTKDQIDAMEFITVEDIDAICGTTIQVSINGDEVVF